MTSATDVARHGPVMGPAAAEPNRRTFLTQAASSAVLAATVTAVSSGVADPIFAAIDLHKSAAAGFRASLDWHSRLDRELPLEKCRSSITVWETKIVETDDPEWIECQRAVFTSSDAETEAACALVNVLPTSMAGVVALLQYAVGADPHGEAWPIDLLPDENSKRSRSWHHFLIANLAAILPGMVQA